MLIPGLSMGEAINKYGSVSNYLNSDSSVSSSGSHSSVSSSGLSKDDYSKQLTQLIKTMQQTNSTSAYNAALAAARETNSFNAQQAEINRQFQQSSAERQMQFERDEAIRAQEFSRSMSDTQYQRAVADLKAAGLSPLLAYGNMQTSSPSGVAASGSAASGSAASGVRADTSNALAVERESLDRLLSMITLNVNSALHISDSSIKLVDALIPG